MKKRALFVPLPEYGHIIPTLKLAKKLVSDGWKVDYFVYDEFDAFLRDQELGVIIDKHRRIVSNNLEDWEHPSMSELDRVFYQRIEEIDDYSIIFFDTYLSYCAVSVKNCNTKCVNYIIIADCESLASVPLCYYIKTAFVRKLPGMSKLMWLKALSRACTIDKCLMQIFFKKNPLVWKQSKSGMDSIIREVKRKGISLVPSPVLSMTLDLNTVVLGPRALSERHLPEERYLGFCMDNAGTCRKETCESFVKSHKTVTYCSFGSMSARYPETLKIIQCIIEAFKNGEYGGLILQAGNYYERLIKHDGINIKIVPTCDQKSILSVCQFAITHGGYGSIKECVRYAVPMIVVPLYYDQFHNATVVERLAIGYVVRRKNANTINIRKAMKTLIRRKMYKKRLSKIYNRERDECEFEGAYRFLLKGVGEVKRISTDALIKE